MQEPLGCRNRWDAGTVRMFAVITNYCRIYEFVLDKAAYLDVY